MFHRFQNVSDVSQTFYVPFSDSYPLGWSFRVDGAHETSAQVVHGLALLPFDVSAWLHARAKPWRLQSAPPQVLRLEFINKYGPDLLHLNPTLLKLSIVQYLCGNRNVLYRV